MTRVKWRGTRIDYRVHYLGRFDGLGLKIIGGGFHRFGPHTTTKNINRGGRFEFQKAGKKRLQSKVTVNQALAEAVSMPSRLIKIKKQKSMDRPTEPIHGPSKPIHVLPPPRAGRCSHARPQSVVGGPPPSYPQPAGVDRARPRRIHAEEG